MGLQKLTAESYIDNLDKLGNTILEKSMEIKIYVNSI